MSIAHNLTTVTDNNMYHSRGAARMASALVLADQLMINFCNDPLRIATHCQELASSLSCIYARVHFLSTDETEIAFANAKLSNRGSIRRAFDTVTWLGTLCKLRKANPNLDAG